MLEGSCLCKAVSFTLDGKLREPRYCHCANCRKFSGTSPASWAMAESAKMSIKGEGAVARFDSGQGIRCFCKHCGSSVWFESKDFPEIVGIPLGVIDAGDVPAPQMHLWVRSKPDWYTINDALTQHETHPF